MFADLRKCVSEPQFLLCALLFIPFLLSLLIHMSNTREGAARLGVLVFNNNKNKMWESHLRGKVLNPLNQALCSVIPIQIPTTFYLQMLCREYEILILFKI